MKRKSISLDADIASAIEQQAADEDRTFSAVLNRTLRPLLKMPKRAKKIKPQPASV
jgi:hypothetical protein